MIETFDIAGYARISVDDEQEQKNIPIATVGPLASVWPFGMRP